MGQAEIPLFTNFGAKIMYFTKIAFTPLPTNTIVRPLVHMAHVLFVSCRG